ncbi:hypothetical protein CYY_000022 [Polysphondylium violaceum]|uniref:UBX domain-containing protein n=1 Tax=Polysphondylium violaceum TaxID=133409 RepID=A0A8J4Q2K3_9MYCE|nr:hypothetical protein CYY_000022 [Polysphondylium violaceum]
MLPQLRTLIYVIGAIFFFGSVITIVYEVVIKPYFKKRLQKKYDALTLTKKKTDMDEEKEEQVKKRQDSVEILGLEKEVRNRKRKDQEKLSKKENNVVYSPTDSTQGTYFKDQGRRALDDYDDGVTASINETRSLIRSQEEEYMESLFLDQRREQNKKELERLEQQRLAERQKALETLRNNLKPEPDVQDKDIDPSGITKILLKFPDGLNQTRRFLKHDKIQDILDYINSLDNLNDKEYELILTFPKKVLDKPTSTLEENDLHPSSSLYIHLK